MPNIVNLIVNRCSGKGINFFYYNREKYNLYIYD